MAADQANTVFYHYPVFRLGRKLAFFFRKSVTTQSCFMALLSILLFLSCSGIDHTWLMNGKNTGLLEHPTIWAFFIIQIISPVFLKKAIERLFTFLKENDIIDSKKELSGYLTLFNRQTSRQMNFSRFSFVFLSFIGLICFAWNSFQNQAPLKFQGFDFWDSFNHPFVYWLSRI